MCRPRSGLSLHPSMSGPWLAVRRALLPRPLSFQCPIGRTSAQPLRGAVWECRGVTHCFARSEEHTSELQSLMRISYAVFCLKKQQTEQLTAFTTDVIVH